MDFTNKPSDFNKSDQDELLKEIDSKPAGTEPEFMPAPAVANAGKEGRVKKILGLILLTLLILGLAAATGWFWWQNELSQASLRQKETETAAIQAKLDSANDKDKVTPVAAPKLTSEEKVERAAGSYVCAMEDFGCDKNTYAITKQQEPKADSNGYAIVTATSSTNKTTTLYLTAREGTEWVVIYEGQAQPSAATIEKFAIPAAFLGASGSQSSGGSAN